MSASPSAGSSASGTFKIDYDSVKKICGDSTEAMVYGFQDCQYVKVTDALKSKDKDNPIQRVFDYTVGINTDLLKNDEDKKKYSAERLNTLDGKKIEQIVYELPPGTQPKNFHGKNLQISRECKAGITNIILENYKRKKEGKQIIPIIFCVDIDNNPYPIYPEKLTTKLSEENRRITHSEIRRCFRLCKGLEADPDLKELQDVANESFKFVKLVSTVNGEYTLKAVKAPWENPGWKEAWAKRQVSPTSKKSSWVNQLKNIVLQLSGKKSEIPPMTDMDFMSLALHWSEDLMDDCKTDKIKKKEHVVKGPPSKDELRKWLTEKNMKEELKLMDDPGFDNLYLRACEFFTEPLAWHDIKTRPQSL